MGFCLANDDPTRSQRSTALWFVVSVICDLVVLLTLSDLSWDEIARTIGCPWYRMKYCSSNDDDDKMENDRAPSPDPENNLRTRQ